MNEEKKYALFKWTDGKSAPVTYGGIFDILYGQTPGDEWKKSDDYVKHWRQRVNYECRQEKVNEAHLVYICERLGDIGDGSDVVPLARIFECTDNQVLKSTCKKAIAKLTAKKESAQ